jgi:hypothetical protein
MLPSSAAPRPLAVAHEILCDDDDDDDNDDGVVVWKASSPLAFALALGHPCTSYGSSGAMHDLFEIYSFGVWKCSVWQFSKLWSSRTSQWFTLFQLARYIA